MVTSRPVAVVTGCAGSLGTVMCAALITAGYDVVGSDLPGPVNALPDDLISSPHFTSHTGDINDPEAVEMLVGLVGAHFRALDLLVNNAAIDTKVVTGAPGAVVDPIAALAVFPASEVMATFETNVVAPFRLVQALLPLLERSARAAIVNIASIYGVLSPNQNLYREAGAPLFKGPDYPVSKAGLISLSNYLAATLGHVGIRSNAISPGGVDLGQDRQFVDAYAKGTPLARMATPQDVAAAVVFLASPESGYITGHNLVVDGGRTTW